MPQDMQWEPLTNSWLAKTKNKHPATNQGSANLTRETKRKNTHDGQGKTEKLTDRQARGSYGQRGKSRYTNHSQNIPHTERSVYKKCTNIHTWYTHTHQQKEPQSQKRTRHKDKHKARWGAESHWCEKSLRGVPRLLYFAMARRQLDSRVNPNT